MKVLPITSNDLEGDLDWLTSPIASGFISGGYSHVNIDGTVYSTFTIMMHSGYKRVLVNTSGFKASRLP